MMNEEQYRALLQNLTRRSKTRRLRLGLVSMAALVVLGLALWKAHSGLALMAALLAFIAYQDWEEIKLARKTFQAIEFLVEKMASSVPESRG